MVFGAGNHAEAQSVLKERWLLDDLRELKSSEAPLWDGKQQLTVGNASAAERNKYQRELKHHQHEDLPMIYLIDLY